MSAWETILFAFGGNAALLAVLGILGKSILDKLIIRDTKLFETDLEIKSNAAIEKLKNDLQIGIIEHQVRFSSLHEKRAQVIAELYGHLVESLWEAESFLSPMEWAGEPKKEEKYSVAMNKLAEFYRYFDKHRIYLPHNLGISLEEEVIKKVRSHVINFGVYIKIPYPNVESQNEKRQAWLSGWKAIKDEIPVTRKALEDEFRELLGALTTLPVANKSRNSDAPPNDASVG